MEQVRELYSKKDLERGLLLKPSEMDESNREIRFYIEQKALDYLEEIGFTRNAAFSMLEDNANKFSKAFGIEAWQAYAIECAVTVLRFWR